MDDRRDLGYLLSAAPWQLRRYARQSPHYAEFDAEEPRLFEKVANLLDAFNAWRMLFVRPAPPETGRLHEELTDAWEKLDVSRVVVLARRTRPVLSVKAYFIWIALEALTAQGAIFSHQNVQQWLALNTAGAPGTYPGITVSPRHYRRIKRLFCEHNGLAG
jgi:hypothetical protein